MTSHKPPKQDQPPPPPPPRRRAMPSDPRTHVTETYTPEQATALLAFIDVKIPGVLAETEQTLRSYDMWPESETT